MNAPVTRLMKEWFSCQELADLAIAKNWKGVPSTKRGWQKHSKRENWRSDHLCRKRQGYGGGLEFHFSLLPEYLHTCFQGDELRKTNALQQHKPDARQIVRRKGLELASLSGRQREVMGARNIVLSAIDAMAAVEGWSRRQVILEFVDCPSAFEVPETTLAVANDRSNGSAKISRSTLFHWFKLRDGSLGEDGRYDETVLAPRNARPVKVHDWHDGFLKFWGQPNKPCITQALYNYKASLDDPSRAPSYDQCKRFVARLGAVAKHVGREGKLTLKSRQAFVMRSTEDLLPTSIYISDGKTLDAEIADPVTGRPIKPEVTTILDVKTRKAVGFWIDRKENAFGTVNALRHAVEHHGIPAVFYVDLGSGFKNDLQDNPLTGFMGRLGITKHHSIAHNSQARGIIERFNGSFWNPLAESFPTYTGAKMDRQEKQRVFKVTRGELKAFGESKTLPSWDALYRRCVEKLAEYNNTPHRSLSNELTPNQAWEAHVAAGFIPVMLTDSEKLDLWRPYEKRRVQRCMLKHNTNDYFSPELEEYHGRDVLVGYDIHDATKLWVREIEKTADGAEMGRFICVAEFEGNKQHFIPHTMHQAALERRVKSQKARLEQKLDRVEEQLKPHVILEHQPIQTVELTEKPQSELIAVNKNAGSKDTVVFVDEAALGRWALNNSEKLTENQRSVLKDCLQNSTDRDWFALEGIDIERLRNMLRQVA